MLPERNDVYPKKDFQNYCLTKEYQFKTSASIIFARKSKQTIFFFAEIWYQ